LDSYRVQAALKQLLEDERNGIIAQYSNGNGDESQTLNTLDAFNASAHHEINLVLEPDARYGLAGDFIKAIEPHSEADPVAILITLLVFFGNVIGRSAHFTVEESNHYLNLFSVLVGLSSKGRKGLSASTAGYTFSRIDSEWSSHRKKSGLSSGEGLVNEVRDERYEERPIKEHGRVTAYEHVRVDEGVSDKRLLVLEEEFSQGLKTMQREGNILSPIIRQAWDHGNLTPMTKHSPIKATGAHISILGHITKDELLRQLTETEQGNGYANRFLWFIVKRSKELPDGAGTPKDVLDPLIGRLCEAVNFAKDVKQMTRDEGARALWHASYHDLSEGKPGLVGAITARGEPQTMRLACIYALLDQSAVVKEKHLSAALALWDYSENCAKSIFGDLSGDPVADRIMGALKRNPDGMTETDIYNMFGRNVAAAVILRALESLARKGLIESESVPTAGRPKTVWKACTQ
jgi:hypothetical protein